MLTVVFDLDGTLADTSGDLLAAANKCFIEMGHGPVLTVAQDRSTALRGGRAMLTAGFKRLGIEPDEESLATWYPFLLKSYGEAIDVHTRFYPGAIEAVEQLCATGHPVGICTNKPEALARHLLESLGALEKFDALIGADTLPVRKPDPEPLRETVRRAGGEPSRTVLIGDTITDHTTARAAEALSVLVTFDNDRAELEAMGPDALLDDFAALPQLVAELGSRF